MKRRSLLIAGFLMIGILGACTASISIGLGGPGTVVKSGIGEYFTDTKGMSLYTYDPDTPGKSKCNGLCAVFWPPVIATNTAKPTPGLTIITRDDGAKQWAYNGKPLYGYANDTRPGDTSGDGFDAVWHIARR